MWCVASAPIVPLARDLDAALGMPRGELAVHFRKLSTPLPTPPLPSRAAPAFLPQGALPLSRPPFSISSRTHISSTRCSAAFSPPLLYLGLHPRFFHKVPSRFLANPLLSRAHPRFFHTPPTPLRLARAVSAPSRTCATSRPAARHSLRAAISAKGTFFRKHKKTSTVPWGAVLVLGC